MPVSVAKPLSINIPDYIHQLVAHLYQTYEVNTGRIRLERDLDPLYLDLDTAVACGLIINELVSNSLKYAFPAGAMERFGLN